MPVALDAAHVKWWAMGGPDTIDNGVCLCSLHHKLFDKGCPRCHRGLARHRVRRLRRPFCQRSRPVLCLAGRPTTEPQALYAPPKREHIAWHQREICRGPARAVETAGRRPFSRGLWRWSSGPTAARRWDPQEADGRPDPTRNGDDQSDKPPVREHPSNGATSRRFRNDTVLTRHQTRSQRVASSSRPAKPWHAQACTGTAELCNSKSP
jgi:hypothetical protein